MPSTTKLRSIADHRDPALDGLRGAAVLLVFLFHYGGGLRAHTPLLRAMGYLTQGGWIGVEIFFALSGFLITRLLLNGLNSPHFLRNFFGRRALRILPLYLAALCLSAVAALARGASLSALTPLLLYAFFLQNIPPLVGTALHAPPPLPLHHLWSLAVEEQFYLLWPFALGLARTPRRVLQLCLAVFIASFGLRLLLFGTDLLPASIALSFSSSLPVRVGALALGGAFAAFPSIPYSRRSLATVAAASLAIFLGVGLRGQTLLLNNHLAYTLGLPAIDIFAATLVALSLLPGLLRTLLSLRPLQALGRISYGFYVFHLLLQPVVDRLSTGVTGTTSGFSYQAARLFVAFPLTYVVSWLSFRLLERPFLRMGGRFPQPSALQPPSTP